MKSFAKAKTTPSQTNPTARNLCQTTDKLLEASEIEHETDAESSLEESGWVKVNQTDIISPISPMAPSAQQRIPSTGEQILPAGVINCLVAGGRIFIVPAYGSCRHWV